MARSAFVLPLRVRFGDCDPAGIAYFPRIFDWFHQAMESWFDEGLRAPYSEVLGRRGLGLPAVHSEADFRAPCRMGDGIDVHLVVERLGDRSLTLGYRITGRDDPSDLRATGRTVVAVIDRATHEAIPVPDDLRDRIAAWIRGDARCAPFTASAGVFHGIRDRSASGCCPRRAAPRHVRRPRRPLRFGDRRALPLDGAPARAREPVPDPHRGPLRRPRVALRARPGARRRRGADRDPGRQRRRRPSTTTSPAGRPCSLAPSAPTTSPPTPPPPAPRTSAVSPRPSSRSAPSTCSATRTSPTPAA